MRIALGVEYVGSEFSGWQAQVGLRTVQATLEKALSIIAGEPIKVFCAGRTDAGVHGINQVVHFDTTVQRVDQAWVRGTNMHLPRSIAVQWSREVDEKFHARFNAIARRYHYVIYNHLQRSAILDHRVYQCGYTLNVTLMQQSAKFLLGEHDFSSFRSSRCQSKTPMRNIHFLDITERGKFITFDIKANAFLHHMVRNIVGTLLRVGREQIAPEDVATILAAKDRRVAYETAPGSGLYLSQVVYREPYIFPQTTLNLF